MMLNVQQISLSRAWNFWPHETYVWCMSYNLIHCGAACLIAAYSFKCSTRTEVLINAYQICSMKSEKSDCINRVCEYRACGMSSFLYAIY